MQYQANPGLSWTGRMYPPMQDRIVSLEGGGKMASTKGHDLELRPNGEIVIRVKGGGKVVFEKKGAQ